MGDHMAKRNSEPRDKRSPTETVENYSNEFAADLDIPPLPDSLPNRLEEAIAARVEAFLFRLKEAQQNRYVRALEIRLIRDAHAAVLTAYELRLRNAGVWYARFREAVEALGYERTDIGFTKVSDE